MFDTQIGVRQVNEWNVSLRSVGQIITLPITVIIAVPQDAVKSGA